MKNGGRKAMNNGYLKQAALYIAAVLSVIANILETTTVSVNLGYIWVTGVVRSGIS